MASENKFPTVSDLHAALSSLMERGLGELAIQILVAPDSTLQAIARSLDPAYSGKPALMIDLTRGIDGRLPAAIISTERLGERAGPPTSTQ